MGFIDHFYVASDLQAPSLQLRNHEKLADALNDYFSLPADKLKALGAYTLSGGPKRNCPGMYDILQCKNGFDTIIEDWTNPNTPWWQNGEVQLAVYTCKCIRDAHLFRHELGVTKEDLRQRLENGECLDFILELSDGQECRIFKADRFHLGKTVIYIPDLSLNDITYSRKCTPEEIEHIISMCYTGDDFVNVCGDMITGHKTFHACDWQHPGSAVDEEWLYDEEHDPKWILPSWYD